MRHLGNITVTPDNAAGFTAASEIFGHLTIAGGVVMTAPYLSMIRGWLTLQPGASIAAAKLGVVNGWVTLQEGSWLIAPYLTTISADLIIAPNVKYDDGLVEVGALNIQRGASARLTSLVRVRTNVAVAGGAQLTADRLESVGNSITLREDAKFFAASLSHIGGYYDAEPTATFLAPKFGV